MQLFFRKINKLSDGFTLVETLVAISIFTVSIMALMSVLAQGTADTRYAKQKIVATYLAQEGIEYIRNMRDTYVLYPATSNDWNKFNAKLTPCNSGNECGFDSSKLVTDNAFIFKCSSGDCKLYIDNGSYNTSVGTDSGFVRKIEANPILNNEGTIIDGIKFFVTVSWTQGSGNKSIVFSESLFNWIE